jgi:hypothetical protein
MATFIQGVTDTNLDPVLFTPDYSFLRYNLQKKSAQYEQGLKSVSNAYGSLKKELSDPINVERRDNYLKAAETELQKIASADLSLQQNVNAANAIFDPIATDPAIAFDAYHTSRIKRELSEMESWADSEDMATRKKFNNEIYSWLKRDLDGLKNGNGDIKNYKVQGRKAWAFVDAQDIVNQAAKDMGYKIENDSLGQPYIITTIGGKTNRESYELFAQNVLAANPVYQQQTKILGQARIENILDFYKNDPLNAGLDKTQLLNKYSDVAYTEGRNRQKGYIENLNEKLAVQKADYIAFHAANPNPQGETLALMQRKLADLNQFKSQVDNIQKEYSNTYGADDAAFKLKKENFTKQFIENPEGYFANQVRTEDVVRWSNIRSSFGTVSIKPDQGYISMVNAADKALNTLNNIKDDQFDNQMDVEELKVKQLNAALKLQGKTATGERKKNADGTDKLPDIEFNGISSTQVNVTTKIDQLKDELALAKAGAITNMTSTFGGLYLLENMGTKPEDVALIRQFFTNQQFQSNAKPTKEQGVALKNAYRNLFSFVKLNNRDEALTEMRGQVDKNISIDKVDFPGLLKKAVANYVPKDEEEKQAIRNIFEYDKNQALIKTKTDAINKGVNFVGKTIMNQTDEELKKLVKKEGDDYRLLDKNDVKEWFNGLKTSGQLNDAQLEELAGAYINGKVKVNITKPEGAASAARSGGSTLGYVDITYNDKKYYLNGTNPNIINSADYIKLSKRINERIPVPEFEASVPGAVVKGSAGYIFRGDTKEKTREFLASPTQDNSNIFISEDGTANGYAQVDPEQQKQIRSALASKENVEMVKLWVNSPINEGKQVVEVTFAAPKSEKDTNPAAGKTFYFPINVNERTSDIFKTFAEVNDEFSNYSTKNEPYVMDYHQASGVMAKIYADQPGSRTGTVRVYTKYDPVTRQYGDTWIEQKPLQFNLNNISFSELKDVIYNDVLSPYVSSHMAYTKQMQTQQAAQGTSNPWNQLKLNW